MLKRLMLATTLALLPAAAVAEQAAVVPAAAPAQAGPASTVQLVWQVYLGGFNLGNVGLKTSFAGNGYSAVSRLKTAGVVNSFYEAVIDANSVGAVGQGMIVPKKYMSNTVNEKQSQKVDLTYTAAGIQLEAEPAYNTSRFPVSEEQKRGTLDPLSGIVYSLSGVSHSAAKPCGDTVRVFDGRRRYDIELKPAGSDNVKSDGGYSGPAQKCTIVYKQLAGFKPNLNKGKAIPTITVWFAKMESTSGGPVKAFIVPVKIMTETPYGIALAHARKITIDGTQKTS
jgi:hypothetical protein